MTDKTIPEGFRTELKKSEEEKLAEEKATRWSDKHEWPPRPTDGVDD